MLLTPLVAELIERARELRDGSLRELLQHTDPERHPQYLAALFRCVQQGSLISDLAQNPLCASTRIRMPVVQHG